MARPADPRRLIVIDRAFEAIKLIRSGSDYFYTPAKVQKRYTHWREVKAFPLYMVFGDSGGDIKLSGHNLFEETFYFSVRGYVSDKFDTVTKVERAVRDIRRCIDQDSKDRDTPGALGTLGWIFQIRIDEPPTTDNGYLSMEGFGYFNQRIRAHISGNFGEL
jgi:hypothetical protein